MNEKVEHFKGSSCAFWNYAEADHCNRMYQKDEEKEPG